VVLKSKMLRAATWKSVSFSELKMIGLVSNENIMGSVCGVVPGQNCSWWCKWTDTVCLSGVRTALIPICFYRSPPWTQRWCRNSPQKMRKSITGNACLSNTRRGKLKSLTTKYSNLLSFVQLCSLLSHKNHGESAVYALTNNLYLLLFFIGHILLVKLWPAEA